MFNIRLCSRAISRPADHPHDSAYVSACAESRLIRDEDLLVDKEQGIAPPWIRRAGREGVRILRCAGK